MTLGTQHPYSQCCEYILLERRYLKFSEITIGLISSITLAGLASCLQIKDPTQEKLIKSVPIQPMVNSNHVISYEKYH